MLEIRFGSLHKSKREIMIAGLLKALTISAVFPIGIFGLIFVRQDWEIDFNRMNSIDYIFIYIFSFVALMLFPTLVFYYYRNHFFKKFVLNNEKIQIFLKDKIVREIKLSELRGFSVVNSHITFKFNNPTIFSDVGMGNLSIKDFNEAKNFLLSQNVQQVKVSLS